MKREPILLTTSQQPPGWSSPTAPSLQPGFPKERSISPLRALTLLDSRAPPDETDTFKGAPSRSGSIRVASAGPIFATTIIEPAASSRSDVTRTEQRRQTTDAADTHTQIPRALGPTPTLRRGPSLAGSPLDRALIGECVCVASSARSFSDATSIRSRSSARSLRSVPDSPA